MQGVQALVSTRIQQFDHQTGSLFGVDIHEKRFVNESWNTKKEIEPLALEEENQESEEPVEEVDNFQFIEAIDEVATLYQSDKDPELHRLVLSLQPVNYDTGNGFAPINTQLQIVQESEFLRMIENPVYQNETNILKSYFSSQLAEDGLEYKLENTTISMVPQVSVVSEVKVEGNKVKYELENHQILSYEVQGGHVVERYEALSTTDSMSLTYHVEVSNGSVTQHDNGFTIYNESSLPIFSMAHPLVTDANGIQEKVSVLYENGQFLFTVSDDFMNDAAYPILMESSTRVEVNDLWTMSHLGHDVGVAQNFATSVISNISQEDLAYMGWQLPEKHQYHGYLYLGNNPNGVDGTAFGNSYSYYKLHDNAIDIYGLKGKYIKQAFLKTPVKDRSGDTRVYSCTIDTDVDFNQVNYNTTYDLIRDENVRCTKDNLVRNDEWQASINFTDYLKGVSENDLSNNGVLMMLKDGDENYLTLHAHEYYYIDKDSGAFPSIWIEYYNEPEIKDDLSLNDFTFHVRPFTRYSYENAQAIFTIFGVDGLSPLESTVNLKIKDTEENVIAEESMEVKENFRIYPDYIEIKDAQVYDTEESNYQFNRLFGNVDENDILFEMNEVYTIEATSTLDDESITKSTWFQLYEVKNFDVLSSVASFYGVPTEIMIEDNNLQDELIVSDNILFIREPTRNQGKEYVTPNLTDDIKKQIDASLQGRGIECEYDFEPINLNTGNFVLEAKDASLVVYGETVPFGRVYNSTNHDYLGAFGYGWSYSADYRVVPNQDNSQVILILPDGRQYVFEPDENGVYRNGLHQAITLTYQDGVYYYHQGQSMITFDRNGLISSSIDGNGRETNYFHYQGLISAIETPDGRKLLFNYNKDNVIESVTLPGNKKVTYEYDENLNLIGFMDQSENKVVYAYDDEHQMVSWINRNGKQVVKNTYENGQVTLQEDGLGNKFKLTYKEDRTITLDSEGNERMIIFDEVKTTKEILVGKESIEKKEFNQGLLVHHETEDGTVITNTYKDGNLIKTLSNKGESLEYSYDERGNLLSWTNEQDQSASFVYDEKNRLIQTTDISGNIEKIEYNHQGQKVKIIDALGVETVFTYNDLGEVVKETKSTGASESYTYNDAGFLSSKTDQRGNTITYNHSNRNELIQVIYPDQTEERFQYDSSGNQVASQERTGAMQYQEYDIPRQRTARFQSLFTTFFFPSVFSFS